MSTPETVWINGWHVEVGSAAWERLVAQGGEPDDAPQDKSAYADLKKGELEKLVAERELEVTGTGKDGNVTVGDLRAALDAADGADEQPAE